VFRTQLASHSTSYSSISHTAGHSHEDIHIRRVGENHIYTLYIQCFWQGNHQIYSYKRCIYTVLANQPYTYACVLNCSVLARLQAREHTHTQTHTQTHTHTHAHTHAHKNSCSLLAMLQAREHTHILRHTLKLTHTSACAVAAC
jgi:uncharacterized membrane protein YcjF (UPF0283 family)